MEPIVKVETYIKEEPFIVEELVENFGTGPIKSEPTEHLPDLIPNQICQQENQCKWQLQVNIKNGICDSNRPHLAQSLSLHTEADHVYICNVCGENYPTENLLGEHMIAHTESGPEQCPFNCQICGRDFVRFDMLRKHFAKHLLRYVEPDGMVSTNTTENDNQMMHDRNSNHICKETNVLDSGNGTNGKTYLQDIALKVDQSDSENVSHSNVENDTLKAHGNVCPNVTTAGKSTLNESNNGNVSQTLAENHPLKDCKDNIHPTSTFSHITHGCNRKFVCDQCGKCFDRPIKLKEHVMRHNGQWTIYCHLCDKGFFRQDRLQQHIDYVHSSSSKKEDDPRKKHACTECPRRFHRKGHLEEHLMRHRGQSTLHCHICNKGFFRQSILDEHLLRHQSPQPNGKMCKMDTYKKPARDPNVRFSCHLCDKQYAQAKSLKKHILIKHECRLDSLCHICGKAFTQKDTLKKHIELHERNKEHGIEEDKAPERLDCEKCGKVFKKKSYLKDHIKRHEGTGVSCEVCKKAFAKPSELQRHMSKHTPRICKARRVPPRKPNKVQDGRFSCELCGLIYTHTSSLNIHIKEKHSENPPCFSCEICGKSFPRTYQLKTHMIIHSEEKPYKCQICLKAFRSRTYLKSHLAWHKGEKKYVCEFCGHSFVWSAALVEHRRSHTKEKPYSCNFCGRRFGYKNTMLAHKRIHTGEKPFQCDVCHQRFIQRNGLNHHKKSHHL